MKKFLAGLLAGLMVLSMTACGQSDPTVIVHPAEPGVEAPAQGVNITDRAGREVHLEAPAERVVALTADACEILYAIGAGDAIVGRGEYCDWPAEVLEIPAVQSGNETNIEQIIALAPQVVLMSEMAQSVEQIEALENAGIRVVISDSTDDQSIEGVYESIQMVGQLMGKQDQAGDVVLSMQETFASVEEQAKGKEGGKVYFEVSPLEWGLWAAGNNTFMNEIAERLGLENIFSDVEGWGEVSQEQVIERAPDYIVTIAMYFGEGPTPEEEIMSRAGWENIPAVANGKILNLANNELSRPAPRLADGAEALYNFVYGENA